ncbi:hypothetical protein ACN2XU_07995 [Primorskyibacter sp. 2E107]|uniref:hypothetical protein n=1 Tax=Primorskyibacter sp. 2E107 TaxID=3403458 RepID=UPI003AF43A24
MMTQIPRVVTATLLCLTPFTQAAAAEGSALSPAEFQTRIDETVEPAGKAKAPVACAGLVAALRIAAPDGSNAKTTFSELEEEMVFYAMMTRRKAADEDQETALAFTVPFVKAVSAVYLERFQHNQASRGELLDEAVRANFAFCSDMRDEMKAALERS